MTEQFKWSGSNIVNKYEDNKPEETIACQTTYNNLIYDNVSVDKNGLFIIPEEPKAILFHAKNCAGESKRGEGSDYYYEVKPHYKELYRRIDCQEDLKSNCTAYTKDDIINGTIYDVDKYIPFYEKYYTLNVLNQISNDAEFDVYGTNQYEYGEDYPTKSDKVTINSNDGNYSIWGPYDNNNNNPFVSVYTDINYQGLDKTKKYMKNAKGENISTKDRLGYGKQEIGSLLIPPHIILDMFEDNAYNTNFGQVTIDNIPKNSDSINVEDTSIFEKSDNKGLTRLYSQDLKTDDEQTNPIPLIFNTSRNQLNPYYQNYDKELKYNNAINYVDDVNDKTKKYNVNKIKSMQAMRREPWLMFLRNCAVGMDGYGPNICKNYTNYYLNPNKSNTTAATQNDADKFMNNYCLTLNNGRVMTEQEISENGSEVKLAEITESKGWKYDKNNEVCGCIRLGRKTTKDECTLVGCIKSGEHIYIPNYRRVDNGCNSTIMNCIAKIDVGKSDINVVNDNIAKCIFGDETTTKFSDIEKYVFIFLLIIIFILVITFLIGIVTFITKNKNKSKDN